jgi:hypothetical protein
VSRARRRGRARAWPHLLLTLPAALALAVSPVSAAMPVAWIEICSGSLTHWIAVQAPSNGPAGEDRGHALCAHATCPRETRIDRKARLPAP